MARFWNVQVLKQLNLEAIRDLPEIMIFNFRQSFNFLGRKKNAKAIKIVHKTIKERKFSDELYLFYESTENRLRILIA